MTVLVSITQAVICFNLNCYPILYGNNTPIGEFDMVERLTDTPGYGGNVIQFKETDTEVYAIHRLWKLNPKQNREKRIKSLNSKDHNISKGCINIEPEVFDKLKDCCIMQKLVITQ